MSTKERRERIKQATRQDILLAARQIAQQDGWGALTVRKVANVIEYSPSIVYEYFASKDALLRTLLQDGFRELAAAMAGAQRSTSAPDQQAIRVVDAYWHFARTNPDLYQVMHGLAGVDMPAALRADAMQAVCAVAADTLATWAAANNVHLHDPIANAETVWSLLHGWVSLTLVDQVYGDEDRAKHLLDDAIAALLRSWSAVAPAV